MKLLLFDLDDTLLRSDKTISSHTQTVLNRCREHGVLIGISTSRSLPNSLAFLGMLDPEIIIASGGALVQVRDRIVSRSEFSANEVQRFLRLVREICGECETTVDTYEVHYWNKVFDPSETGVNWGESVYCDFSEFSESALKICVEIKEEAMQERLVSLFGPCDSIRFSGTDWYKFTRPGVTKEAAIQTLCKALAITPTEITAFGDDIPDIGMLRMCGIGVAMGNALEEVKAAADVVIGSNDTEAIAAYLENTVLLHQDEEV